MTIPATSRRAITLWQPYASLVVDGHKLHETRPRPFPRATMGERIVVHAAVRAPVTAELPDELVDICTRIYGAGWATALPLGAVLGTVVPFDNVPTEARAALVDSSQVAMGDWGPGRWSIALRDPERLPSPVPAKGAQGWWRWPAVTDRERFPLLAGLH